MTLATCHRCGAMKFGALTPCQSCGGTPQSDYDMALAVGLTDHHFSSQKLEEIGAAIAQGSCIELPHDFIQVMMIEAQKMRAILPKTRSDKEPIEPLRKREQTEEFYGLCHQCWSTKELFSHRCHVCGAVPTSLADRVKSVCVSAMYWSREELETLGRRIKKGHGDVDIWPARFKGLVPFVTAFFENLDKRQQQRSSGSASAYPPKLPNTRGASSSPPPLAANEKKTRQSAQQKAPKTRRSGLYKFSFVLTLLGSIVAVPMAFLGIWAAQIVLSIFAAFVAWRMPEGPTLWTWLFGIESGSGDILFDSLVTFLREFICWAVGLLSTFFAFIHARRSWSLRISISAIVVITCVVFLLISMMGIVGNGYYAWNIYDMKLLGCQLSDLYRCNFALLDLPAVSASLSNFSAVIAAGQIYSSRLDDTDAWADELNDRAEQKLTLYGLLK